VNASGLGPLSQISPDGATSNPVTFSWYAAAAATRYRLVAYDGEGKLVDRTYTSAEALCPSGSGICSKTLPDTFANGGGRWYVQPLTETTGGLGTAPMYFTIGAGTFGQPTTVTPNGPVLTHTPTYVWNAATNGTRYLLWVDDSSAKGKIRQYVTAAAAGCPLGTGTCSFTPTTALASGAAGWTVDANDVTWAPGYRTLFSVP
jgi:hypothetical protein